MNNANWIPSAVPFFLFGVCYYLISPYFTLVYFADNPTLSSAYKFIDLSFFDTRYFLDCALITLSWLFGYIQVQKIKFDKSSLDKIVKFKKAPLILGFSLLFLFLFSITGKGVVIFSGYSSYDISVLGPSATILFTSVLFFNYFQRSCVRRVFFIIFLLSSFLMLSLGSRMFFVLGTISLFLAVVSANKKILFNPFFYLLLFGLLVFIVWIGIWRSNGIISSEELVTVFLAEPLFTTVSGATYFENMGGRPLTAFPTDIFASVINFIPTIVFPEKLELIHELTYDPNKYSPYGASALMVNIYSNFGIFFPVYFFSMGIFFGYLRKKAKYSRFYLAVYFSVLPLLMFHFFRDGFITVIKVLFFNAFILPAVIVIFLSFIFHKKSKLQRSEIVSK